jgi:hypothetical protein
MVGLRFPSDTLLMGRQIQTDGNHHARTHQMYGWSVWEPCTLLSPVSTRHHWNCFLRRTRMQRSSSQWTSTSVQGKKLAFQTYMDLLLHAIRERIRQSNLFKIWGFHGGEYEECRLLKYKNSVRTSKETHYVSATEPSRLMLCKIWGFHDGDYEKSRLLGCFAVWLL